ncbi:HD domain-containing protein [Acidaminobacterium chupaoyuni]
MEELLNGYDQITFGRLMTTRGLLPLVREAYPEFFEGTACPFIETKLCELPRDGRFEKLCAGLHQVAKGSAGGGELFHAALEFAANAHAGQKRKGSGAPYIIHPVEVAQILTESGAGDEVICAGLLHDLVEDTGCTAEQIEKAFGPRIAELVKAESEDKSRSWEERKQTTIHHMEACRDLDILLLCCADKVSNLRSLAADYQKTGEAVFSHFKRGRKEQAWYYGSLLGCFEPLSEMDLYWEMADLYGKIFVEYYMSVDLLIQIDGDDRWALRRGDCQWQQAAQSAEECRAMVSISKEQCNAIETLWHLEEAQKAAHEE